MATTTPEYFNGFGTGHLPGLVGVEILTITPEAVASRMAVRKEVMAPNGFLHAASVIALADTSCGYGCISLLPAGASRSEERRVGKEWRTRGEPDAEKKETAKRAG